METETKSPPVTNEEIAHRLDMMGEQMNWLCENLQSLFSFVNTVGNSGGGLRGLMQAMKHSPDLSSNGPIEAESKVQTND